MTIPFYNYHFQTLCNGCTCVQYPRLPVIVKGKENISQRLHRFLRPLQNYLLRPLVSATNNWPEHLWGLKLGEGVKKYGIIEKAVNTPNSNEMVGKIPNS